MAIGKNKKLKTGKKGAKKRIADPFVKKEWYVVRAPNAFRNRKVGQVCVTKTIGTKVASDGLKGRVIECCLADLQGDEELAYRKMKLRVDDIRGNECLTNFHGMDLTTDKLRSLIRKWHTLIEARVDVKTIDGYFVRMFCIALTARRENQLKKTSYAQSSQVRLIRKKMVEAMTEAATTSNLQGLVKQFMLDSITKKIKASSDSVYPLQNVYIRKVKMLKLPKFDSAKLDEIHVNIEEDTGNKVEEAGTAAVDAPAVPAEPLVGEGGEWPTN